MAKEIYIQKKSNINMTKRKFGKEENIKDPEKVIRFLSTLKELMLFKDENYLIKFQNYSYETDNKQDIDFIRKHPSYKRTVFENRYPDWVVDKMKRDKKYIERDVEAFEPAEA